MLLSNNLFKWPALSFEKVFQEFKFDVLKGVKYYVWL